jgi:hypothetical protein
MNLDDANQDTEYLSIIQIAYLRQNTDESWHTSCAILSLATVKDCGKYNEHRLRGVILYSLTRSYRASKIALEGFLQPFK